MSKPKKEIVHRGVHYNRTLVDDAQGKLEKAAAHRWEKMSAERNNSGSNFPASLLAVDSRVVNFGHPAVSVLPRPMTQEEATAMATVFQWMFTSIGRSALYEVCREAGWTLQMSPRDDKPAQA